MSSKFWVTNVIFHCSLNHRVKMIYLSPKTFGRTSAAYVYKKFFAQINARIGQGKQRFARVLFSLAGFSLVSYLCAWTNSLNWYERLGWRVSFDQSERAISERGKKLFFWKSVEVRTEESHEYQFCRAVQKERDCFMSKFC